MSDGCQNYEKGQQPPKAPEHSSGSLERAGYASLSEIPQTILKSNIAFANRMMEAWGVCEATDNLLDVSNEWKRELKRRSEA